MPSVRRLALALIASALVSCDGNATPAAVANAGHVLAKAPTQAAPVPPSTAPSPFPLGISPDLRHLLDRQERAFLVNGDTPWSLMTGVTREEAETYLEDRRRRGFNAILVNIIEHHFNGPLNQYGEHPFLEPRDFSTPNERYFQHVDWVLARAYEKGFLVLATPAYLGFGGGEQGWYQEIKSTSLDVLRGYGRYLGARYRNFDNIVWVAGGDYGSAESLPFTRAIVQGLQETDSARIFTAHNARFQSGVEHYQSESWVTLNTTYSDCVRTAEQSLADYQRPRIMPFLFIEGRYEREGASEVCLRSQAYWSVLSGSVGHFFGAKPVWDFQQGWERFLDSPGSRSMTWFRRLFESRRWHLLTPDLASSLLTSGRDAFGPGFAAAAMTSDRETAIVYIPSRREVTIDLTRLAAERVKAWWYNPRNGEATPIGDLPALQDGRFTPRDEGDWVLVIDAATSEMPAPGQPLDPPPTEPAGRRQPSR